VPHLKGEVSKAKLRAARLARIAAAARAQIERGILEDFAGVQAQDVDECLADCPGIMAAYQEQFQSQQCE
jgi:hypothetical protein